MRFGLMALWLAPLLQIPVAPDWQPFAPADSSFVVLLPGAAELSSRLVESGAGYSRLERPVRPLASSVSSS